MNTVELRHSSGATALVHIHGAHITSWKTSDGVERLFLSKRAEFKAGAAIRGGVPIIFPQFAALGSLPKHGFARISTWHLRDNTSLDTVTFELKDSAETRAIWPFKFVASYQVWLGKDQLKMQLNVKNVDDKPFSFTAALHTYLRTNDIDAVAVSGLQGLHYRDSANGNAEHIENNEAVRFAGEVDRIYFATSNPVLMQDTEHVVQCKAEGFSDTVIWNPGEALSKKLTDMDDDGYKNMVCIEAAAIASPVKLAPDDTWQGAQVLIAN